MTVTTLVRDERTRLPTRRASLLAATGPASVPLRDGRQLAVRGARPADLAEVAALHARCSVATRYGRYLSEVDVGDRRLFAELLATDVAVLALAPGGACVAVANLAADAAGPDGWAPPGGAELAVIVEDAWQGRGLGTALVRHLVAVARLLGHRHVRAVVVGPPDAPVWIVRSLARLGPVRHERSPFGEHTVSLALAPHHVAGLAAPGPPY